MLYVKKLVERAILPIKGSQLAAGYDLYSAEQTVVPAKGKQIVKTGLAIVLPQGTYGRIAPRSGLAAKNFIDVGAGVIDEDYRGEVCVLLFNFGQEDFKVNYGDRIAQLIVEYVVKTEIVETQDLNETQRGAGGFGSTGVQLPKPQPPAEKPIQQEAIKQKNEQGNEEEIWQELTVLNLVGLFQNGLITQEQQQHFGTRVLKGDRKIYEIFKKNEGKNQQIISQQLLNIIEE